jgi:hypothetical protein
MDSIFDRGYQCPNASWNGTFISFCPGLTTDDVTGHEWSHAYTQYTDGLIYAWQPGALNEAASDIFGETLDRINNRGGDTPNTTRNAGACTTFTALPPVVTINSPAAIAGNKPAGTAAFGPQTFTITNDVVLVNDGVAPTGDGCETPFSNAAALNGKFALVDRGLCGFAVKVKNAQLNGAIGVIVANNQPGIVNMGGVDPTITIPSLSVLQTDGAAIKAQLGLGQTVNATLTRATGTDNSVRWLLGEDDTAPGLTGALRDMWNPTCYGNPGKVSDADYGCSAGDQGGVHDNSGVDNHAYSLLVDGGSYNGQTITGIGLTKAAHIWFWAKTHYQGPATDFAEHADALEQSCSDLTDVNLDDLNTGAPSGQIISAADCAELHEVTLAVEFRNPPTQCNFQPLLAKNPPDRCEAGTTQVNVFADTFAKDPFRPNRWTASRENTTVDFTDRDWTWSHDLPDRAGSALFAPDPSIGTCAPGGDESGVLVVTSPPITLPAGAAAPRLTFDHWVSTEAAFDGGNLRISVNGGPWMLVAQADFTFNGYNATLATTAQGNTNPLQGQRAFSGSDGGSVLGSWGRSHVNLAAYATALDTIQLRWDFGTDGCGGVFGWYVDDVTVHACTSNIKPDITINDITVTEGSFTSLFNLFTPATFTVSLSHAYAKPVSVKFVTKPGTAKAILDYIPIAGKATIDPLDLTEDVTTWVIADHKEEPNETFFLDLFNPVNGNLLDNRGMCTIANDDF